MDKKQKNKELTTQETITQLVKILNSPENKKIIKENQEFSKAVSEFVDSNIPVKEEVLSQPFTI